MSRDEGTSENRLRNREKQAHERLSSPSSVGSGGLRASGSLGRPPSVPKSFLHESDDFDSDNLEQLTHEERRALLTKKEFAKYLTHASDDPNTYPHSFLWRVMNFIDPGCQRVGKVVRFFGPFWYRIAMFLLHVMAFFVNIFTYVFLPNEPESKHVWTADKRILFGGSAGLLWYSWGVSAYLMEHWGDRLTEDVCFEGVSGGCSPAFCMAMQTKGLGTITQFAGVGVEEFVAKNESEGWFGLWCFKSAWDIADRFYGMAQDMLRKKHGHDRIEEFLKDRCVFWNTDAYTFKSVPMADFSIRANAADGYVASCYVPGVLGPALAVHYNHPYPGVGLDGGVAQLAGDFSMFQPTHRDGKEIRTLFWEVYPTVPQPPQTNLKTIKIWAWDNFAWYGVHQGLCDPKGATDLYLRGYYAAQKHHDEVAEAMEWLLENKNG